MIKPVDQMDMAELWLWLGNHPAYVLAEGDVPDFWRALPEALSVEFTKVSPKSKRRCKDERRNTQVECWLEFGPLDRPEIVGRYDECLGEDDMVLGEPRATHDIRLDCGGNTFESAFRQLCLKVLAQDGDYERDE